MGDGTPANVAEIRVQNETSNGGGITFFMPFLANPAKERNNGMVRVEVGPVLTTTSNLESEGSKIVATTIEICSSDLPEEDDNALVTSPRDQSQSIANGADGTHGTHGVPTDQGDNEDDSETVSNQPLQDGRDDAGDREVKSVKKSLEEIAAKVADMCDPPEFWSLLQEGSEAAVVEINSTISEWTSKSSTGTRDSASIIDQARQLCEKLNGMRDAAS